MYAFTRNTEFRPDRSLAGAAFFITTGRRRLAFTPDACGPRMHG